MSTNQGSSRPNTRTSAQRPMEAASSTSMAPSAQANIESIERQLMEQELQVQHAITKTLQFENQLSDIFKLLQDFKISIEKALGEQEQGQRRLATDFTTFKATMQNDMTELEKSMNIRAEEISTQIMADAKTIINGYVNEVREESIKSNTIGKDQEDRQDINHAESIGRIAKKVSDPDDHILKLRSNSDGEGKYPSESENHKKRSKSSTPSLKTKRTNSKPKRLRDSKLSKNSSKTRKDSGDPDNSSSSSSSSSDEGKSRKNHKSNTSDTEDSDSSSSSDESVQFVPVRFRKLKNIQVRNSELKTILSYKTYRLRNQSPKFTKKMQKELSKIAMRMKTHISDEQKFTGTDPVSIIRFLEEFKEACDHNGLSEGAALHLFQYFVLDPAKKSLRLFLRSNINDKSHNSYCGAVLFLLTTYAPEDQVNMERRKVFLSQQRPAESENDFAIRVQAQASRLGQAFKESDLITSYLNGLPENIRTYINSVAPYASTFTQTQLVAQSAGKTLKTRAPTPISSIALPPVKRPSRYPAPNYIYQPPSDIRNPVGVERGPVTTSIELSKPASTKTCFVCSRDHHLHECPTLSAEQREHATKANERFLQQRQQREMLRKYNGNGYSGGRQATYLIAEEKEVIGTDHEEEGPNEPATEEISPKN